VTHVPAVAGIGQTGRQGRRETQPFIRFPQQQGSGVTGQGLAVEIGLNFLAIKIGKEHRFAGTLCVQSRAFLWIEKTCNFIHDLQ
jgi:hypothetical protein